MDNLKKMIAVLVLLAGMGHLFLALNFDNPALFGQMIGGGIFYLVLGTLIWFNNKIAMIISTLLMLFGGTSAVIDIHQFGYPVNLMKGFVVLDAIVVVLILAYFHNVRKAKKEKAYKI